MKMLKPNFAIIIGIGNVGCKASEYANFNNTLEDIEFLAVDTNKQDLDNLKIPSTNKLLIGEGISFNDESFKDRFIDSLRVHILKEYKIAFILTEIGNEFDASIAKIIADLCKELKILIFSILSLPKESHIQKQVKEDFNLIKNNSDSVLLIPNEIMRFSKPIDVILKAILGNNQIGFEFDDIKSILENSGIVEFVYGYGSSENRINKVIKEMFNSEFLCNIKSVESILLYIEDREDDCKMDEVSEITDYLKNRFTGKCEIYWAVGTNNDLKDEIYLNAIIKGDIEAKL